MADITSEFVRHEPCNNCGSSDGNSLYSDGHTFCFVCQNYIHGDGEPILHNQQMTTHVQLRGYAVELRKRGLSVKTNELYKIYRDDSQLLFHYYSGDGILQGVKVKTKQKDFYYEGVSTDTLFGQHLFPTIGKRVVVTEGELDAASCYEVMSGWPMVSLAHGAAGGKKDIQKALPFLQGYAEICLFFDNDEAGRKATEECASVLPPGKVTIARLENYKDASEALSAGQQDLVRRAIWDAKPYRPDGIVEAKDLLEIVTKPEPPCDHEYPFKGLQDKTHGIRYGELTTITAGTGIGKSSYCRQLATHLLSRGERVGYLALEESNRRTALGLMSTAVGKALHLGTHEKSELEEAYRSTIANWNLFLFDGFGSYESDLIYSRIEYLACGLECRVIFLDHLSILLSGLDGDERRMIDQTMTKLRSLVERTGIHLFLVSHLRRTQTDKNHEEGARVTLGQLRGSASISQISDNLLALERNQQSNQVGSSTTLRVLKNRYSGETGIAANLTYNLQTCRFEEDETAGHTIFNAVESPCDF